MNEILHHISRISDQVLFTRFALLPAPLVPLAQPLLPEKLVHPCCLSINRMSDSDSEDITPSRPQPEDDNANLPALFWDNMPENAEENPDYIALKALEEDTPLEERAETFKVQGNNKLRIGLKSKNRLLLREAVDFYDKGLALKCPDQQINLALHNNRAHVNSLLGNWRNALTDSQAAMQLDPGNLKAVFRGARAALKLGEWQQCEQLVAKGLQLDPQAQELQRLQQELAAERKRHEDQLAAQAAAKEAALAPARKLAAALILKGYKLTVPEVHVGNKKPYVDRDGAMHWPALLLYPETGQQDVVEDWHEGDRVADHLDEMFGPKAPPLEWDTDQEYTRERVQLYYLSHAGQTLKQDELVQAMHGQWPEIDRKAAGPKRYGQAASHWVAVDESLSLRQVLLQQDHIIPGVPLFWVLAKGTDYQRRFLAEELRRF